ncbi:PaaI family thioesterase [Propylenella binzhouense]|uniref:Medium/long-chain acyl-CoA thioesterase YigI n=1 Tax=Propylenella binzhouense TaxID=2555902 RepID=A0A964T1T2_9HYPH|nr:PaaI family thioesterase [Propylenella binzhouense]MYZ46883.1 PaaI family thioesterase [Propylenella binzhouense]
MTDGSPMSARAQSDSSAGWRQIPDASFATLLGPLWLREEDGRPVFGFQTEARHANSRGVVHGGVLALFADHALGRSLRLQERADRQATIQLQVQYIAPVIPGDFLEARAEVLRSTTHVAYLRGILSVGGKVVVETSGLWKLSRGRRESAGAELPDAERGQG